MKRSLQLIIQTAFLGLFVLLFLFGKIQLWMGLLLSGIFASFWFGRVYCGWICPINTGMNAVTWVKKKLHIKDIKIPNTLTKSWVRTLIVIIFFATFAFTIITGKKLPVLPILFIVGVILTFFFPEELWHHLLCPYGTLMSFPTSRAKHNMLINEHICSNCGACVHACPASAIRKEDLSHKIIKEYCIVCMECSRICKKGSISYN